ncbi:MAG: hypothetical protein IPM77_00215 [Crocinitomicaceae bacterium]|nr:hypothetical protein [Crocinitomicaceae bacterium]
MRHGIFEEYYQDDKNTMKYTATYKKDVLLEEHYYNEFGEEIAPDGSKPTNNGTTENGGTEEGGGKKKKDKKKKKE